MFLFLSQSVYSCPLLQGFKVCWARLTLAGLEPFTRSLNQQTPGIFIRGFMVEDQDVFCSDMYGVFSDGRAKSREDGRGKI